MAAKRRVLPRAGETPATTTVTSAKSTWLPRLESSEPRVTAADFTSDLSSSDWLEPFLQMGVSEPAVDRGKRLVVVVIEVFGHKADVTVASP